jgi:nickel-dependent lactate racemase
LPDNYVVESIEAVDTPALKNPELAVRKALDDLIGDVKWSDLIGAHSVAIAVNDKTRPVPHSHLLPPLLEQLNSLGIPDEAIRFFVAGGTQSRWKQKNFH